MISSGPDLIRLLLLPVFVYVAVVDIRTRRIPRIVWPPVIFVAMLLLLWEGWSMFATGGLEWQLWSIRAAISVGIVAPLGYLFWRFGAFGLADAKALIAIAILFPTYPTVEVGDWLLPLVVSDVGVFSLTILVNGVFLGLAYPLGLAAVNVRRREFRVAMFVGLAVPAERTISQHGRLLASPDTLDRGILDLDALRMYLRWRDVTLEELRGAPAEHRDPGSLPASPQEPGDGRIRTDGGGVADPDDDWGARAFVEATGGPYGTRTENLREALEVLCERDVVWIMPGIPFLLLLGLGLFTAVIYGSLITAIMHAAGL